MWAHSFRSGVPTAGQTGTNALEGYHGALKSGASGLRKRRIRYRRVDWLFRRLRVDILNKFKHRQVCRSAVWVPPEALLLHADMPPCVSV